MVKFNSQEDRAILHFHATNNLSTKHIEQKLTDYHNKKYFNVPFSVTEKIKNSNANKAIEDFEQYIKKLDLMDCCRTLPQPLKNMHFLNLLLNYYKKKLTMN